MLVCCDCGYDYLLHGPTTCDFPDTDDNLELWAKINTFCSKFLTSGYVATAKGNKTRTLGYEARPLRDDRTIREASLLSYTAAV